MKFLNKIKKKLKGFFGHEKRISHPPKPEEQNRTMTNDEKVDEYISESFPASDPPAHFSHTNEDRNLH